jgi:hypothetical protein
LEALWNEISNPLTTTNNNNNNDDDSSTSSSTTRVLANVVLRLGIVQPDDITMLTHISANKMDRLLLLHQFWGGPMSVAVWIKSLQDVHDFYSFISTSSTTRVLANVVPRLGIVQPDDITMLTHISANKMDRLLLLHQFWGGPMSVAVWIKSLQDVHATFIPLFLLLLEVSLIMPYCDKRHRIMSIWNTIRSHCIRIMNYAIWP